MECDKITVVIPVYNVEDYLDRALKTVVNQTYKNLEIIIVNDGSTDNSEDIVLKYKEKDKRIIYIKQKNAGLSEARNAALKEMTGEYVFFFDSDDFLELNIIEILYEAIRKENADMAICGYYSYNEDSDVRHETNHINENVEIIDTQKINFMKEQYIHHKYENHVWDKLYKTSIIKENHLKFNSQMIEDILFNMEIYPYLNKIVYIKQPLYNYCIRNTSITGKYNVNLFDMYVQLFELLEKYSKERNIDFSYQKFFEYNIYNLLVLCANNHFKNRKYKNFLNDIEKLYKNQKLMKYNEQLENDIHELITNNQKRIFFKLMCKFIKNKSTKKLYYLFFIKYKLKI